MSGRSNMAMSFWFQTFQLIEPIITLCIVVCDGNLSEIQRIGVYNHITGVRFATRVLVKSLFLTFRQKPPTIFSVFFGVVLGHVGPYDGCPQLWLYKPLISTTTDIIEVAELGG
jgi:hypothetical protein